MLKRWVFLIYFGNSCFGKEDCRSQSVSAVNSGRYALVQIRSLLKQKAGTAESKIEGQVLPFASTINFRGKRQDLTLVFAATNGSDCCRLL